MARRARVTGILGSPGEEEWGTRRAYTTDEGSRRQVSVARYLHGTYRLVTSAYATHRQLLVYMLGRVAKDKVFFGLRRRHHAGRITSAGGLRVCRLMSSGGRCPAGEGYVGIVKLVDPYAGGCFENSQVGALNGAGPLVTRISARLHVRRCLGLRHCSSQKNSRASRRSWAQAPLVAARRQGRQAAKAAGFSGV